MVRIIPLFGDPHREALRLMPWYATGRLDPTERNRVAAHVADCPECRAELEAERALHDAVRTLPVDADASWSAMRERVASLLPPTPRTAFWKTLLRAPAMGWFLAGQFALAMLAMFVLMPSRPTATYHALGSPAIRAHGNLVVIFRPEANEQAIHDAMVSAGARMVDGPTSAGAYVVAVPAQQRQAALASLQASSAILLAQPIGNADGS